MGQLPNTNQHHDLCLLAGQTLRLESCGSYNFYVKYQWSVVLNNGQHVLPDLQCLFLQLVDRAYDDFDVLLKALDQLIELHAQP